MKVSLDAEEGGFGAGAQLPAYVVDSNGLSPAEAAELERLVSAAKADKTVTRGGPMRAKITIEDGGKLILLDQLVSEMSPPFAALRRWLRARASRKL